MNERNALALRNALTLYINAGIIPPHFHEDMRKSASLMTGEQYSTYESAEQGLTKWLEGHSAVS